MYHLISHVASEEVNHKKNMTMTGKYEVLFLRHDSLTNHISRYTES